MRMIYRIIDILLIPFVLVSSWGIFLIRKIGERNLLISNKLFLRAGILPIRNYYNLPQEYPEYLLKLTPPKTSININANLQLKILDELKFQEELLKIPLTKTGINDFYYINDSYGPGDAEYGYMMIRNYKPLSIVIYGSKECGRLVLLAVAANQLEDKKYSPHIRYINPYESLNVNFSNLVTDESYLQQGNNDSTIMYKNVDFFLASFLPSSVAYSELHYFITNIFPSLKKGSIVQLNQMYGFGANQSNLTPSYKKNVSLFEAFILNNNSYSIIADLGFLSSNYTSKFSAKCPIFAQEKINPSSIWIEKIKE